MPLVKDNRLAKRARMMPFKQMLTIEPLNDDEFPQSTNEEYEPNAGDKYCQLGDSATVAVLDGTVRAMIGVDTFALMDLGPKACDWARSFLLRMLPGFGACSHYCAFGVVYDIIWTQHCVRESAQDLYLDGKSQTGRILCRRKWTVGQNLRRHVPRCRSVASRIGR